MSQSNDAARELLERRARRLATPLTDSERLVSPDGAEVASLLVIRLGDERAGIALDYITEVYRPGELTPIPGAHPPVVGVVAWRGRVLTVLDIAQNRRGAMADSESRRVVVIGRRRAWFGIIADEVEDAQDVNLQDTSPVEEAAPDRRDFVRGVTAEAVVVLDAAALIARFVPRH